MWKWFLGVCAALFVQNVLTVALDAPWWTRPYTLVLTGFGHVNTWARWAGNGLGWLYVQCAWVLTRVFDRLAPALRVTLADGLAILFQWYTFTAALLSGFAETIRASRVVQYLVDPWVLAALSCPLLLVLVYAVLLHFKPGVHAWVKALGSEITTMVTEPSVHDEIDLANRPVHD